jgi:hypothetical protein
MAAKDRMIDRKTIDFRSYFDNNKKKKTENELTRMKRAARKNKFSLTYYTTYG